MGVEGRGTNKSYIITLTFRHSSKPACSHCIATDNHSLFTFAAVTGPGLVRERGDLVQGTEVEEGAVTMRDVAPETENVQDDSEPQAMTTCPPLPCSSPVFRLFVFF